jgi:hypothetical protein
MGLMREAALGLRRPVVERAARGREWSFERLAAAWPILVPCGAVALWAVSLGRIDHAAMNDLGLISALPPSIFLALLVLVASFCLSLRRPSGSQIVPALHVLALILMVYGITPLVDDVPRYSVTWRHLGVAEYVARTGDVDPGIDAYFNWPGFFIMTAFLTELAGTSAKSFVDWAPVFYNVLYLGPLLIIFRAATTDQRLVWSGVWIFYLANWIGQDYFSPQGLMYFLYLAALAVLVRWFQQPRERPRLARALRAFDPLLERLPRPVRERGAHAQEELRPAQRAGLMAIVIVLLAAIVPSHQLTPFMAFMSIALLVAFNRCSARLLPVLVVVLIAAWMSFMAITYLHGHLEQLTGGVGQLEETAKANVGSRLHGSREHVAVVYVRLLLTAGVWGLALLGGLRALWHEGGRVLPYALLAVAPFPLLPLQPYGGEMLMRVYLFALPLSAFFAAWLFLSARPRTTAIFALVSVALLAALFVARFGNERMDYFTPDEVHVVERLYEVATPGSLLLGGSDNVPWKFQDYEKFDYDVVTEPRPWNLIDVVHPDTRAVLANIQRAMAARKRTDAYLIITRSQKAEVDLRALTAPGFLDHLELAASVSPAFRLVYGNRDAKIFTLAQKRAG